jgi:zinc/manganese transport system permease protein
MIDALVEPWRFGFMQRALLEVLLVALVCGPIGVLLSLRRLAYAGESLGHALVPGAAAFAALGLAAGWGAMIGAVIAAIAVAWLVRRSGASEDVAVALVFSVALAVGVIILTLFTPPQRATAVLFGDLLAVDRGDLLAAAFGAALLTTVVAGIVRAATVVAFDPSWARIAGVRVGLIDVVVLLGAALALGIALRGLGALLGLALLLAPMAVLRPWVRRVRTLLLLSAPLGALGGVVGLYLSYAIGLAAGPTIATVLLTAFLGSRVVAAMRFGGVSFPRSAVRRGD